MGSPLIPIVADIVMNKLINFSLPKLNFTPNFVYKYVDDLIFTAPPNEIEPALSIFNSFHERLQFTFESQIDNKINYLDMTLIINLDNSIDTNWFAKKTSKYRLLNFHSSHSFTQKSNIISNTIRRTLSLSSKKFWNDNITIIKNGLTKNNYPPYLIEKYLQKFLNAFQIQQNSTNNTNNTLAQPQIPPKIFSSISFVENLSLPISFIFKDVIPDNPLKITFRSDNNNKQNFFSKLKDKTDKSKICNVVYKINCNDCNNCYIGETSQYLSKRLYQHGADMRKFLNPNVTPRSPTPSPNNSSNILPIPQNIPPPSIIPIINTPNNPSRSPNLLSNTNSPNKLKDYTTALAYHTKDTKHEFDLNGVEILCKESNYQKRLTKESLFILSYNNSINKKSDSNGISQVYIDLINNLNK